MARKYGMVWHVIADRKVRTGDKKVLALCSRVNIYAYTLSAVSKEKKTGRISIKSDSDVDLYFIMQHKKYHVSVQPNNVINHLCILCVFVCPRLQDLSLDEPTYVLFPYTGGVRANSGDLLKHNK